MRAEGRGVTGRFVLAGIGAAALALLGLSVERVVRRMGFDYDLLLWADDFFMTGMYKLLAGVPLYSAVADANSTIYAPGGAYLHHALLAPLGLSTSLLANRVLGQLWLAAAVGLSTATVVSLARARGAYPPARRDRALFALVAASLLGLAMYANPVADALHPSNLELAVLAAAQLVLARWEDLSEGRRRLWLLALPAAALLAKQTAGVAVTLSLAGWALGGSSEGWQRRCGRALLPVVSLALILAALVWVTDGMFRVWGLEILRAQPYEWWKASDIYAGYFLLFAPVVITAAAGAVVLARRERRPGDAGWLRAASIPAVYAPFALMALFKAMGGPNNLAALGFLAAPPALALLLPAPFTSARRRTEALVLGVLAVQAALWYPRRRVPEEADREKARLICEYAAARMRCGERVLLGRGSVCYARGGIRVPVDRMNSIVEVAVAGRGEELGFFGRVARREYDVIILPVDDLVWFGGPLWEIMKDRYRPFHMTRGEAEGDFWFHGWQGYVTRPMVFWERIEDAGRHAVEEPERGCAVAERRRR